MTHGCSNRHVRNKHGPLYHLPVTDCWGVYWLIYRLPRAYIMITFSTAIAKSMMTIYTTVGSSAYVVVMPAGSTSTTITTLLSLVSALTREMAMTTIAWTNSGVTRCKPVPTTATNLASDSLRDRVLDLLLRGLTQKTADQEQQLVEYSQNQTSSAK